MYSSLESDTVTRFISLVIVGDIALFALTYLDFVLLKGTPLRKFSKVFHVSAFSGLIWVFTLVIGMIVPNFFNSNYQGTYSNYLLEGLLFVVGFRICMFKSVFGATLRLL
jgi:putative membrane protein